MTRLIERLFRGVRWIEDDEGDFGISFWDILSLVKYKEHVLYCWFKKFPDAPKYLIKGE